jgi:hypothetical protein
MLIVCFVVLVLVTTVQVLLGVMAVVVGCNATTATTKSNRTSPTWRFSSSVPTNELHLVVCGVH